MNEINQRIRELRLKHGLTMAKFAELIHVSPGNISDWEGGKKKSTPSAKALIAIAEQFDLSLDWLMTGTEKRRPPSEPSEAAPSPIEPWVRALSKDDLDLLQLLAGRLARPEPAATDKPGGRKKTPRLSDADAPLLRESGLATEYYVKLPVVGRVTAGVPIMATENIEEYFTVPRKMIGAGIHFLLRVSGDSMLNAGIDNGDLVIVRQQQTADNGEIIVAMTDEDEATVKTFYKEQDHIRLQPENDQFTPLRLRDVTVLGKVVSVLKSSEQGA